MDPIRTIIMGAAGRDFHNFNVIYRDHPNYNVVAFTATQIPNIDGRRYPASLAGDLYPGGIPIHPDIKHKATGKPLAFRPENQALRDRILQTEYDASSADLFKCSMIIPRTAPMESKAFEPAWQEYRTGKIYGI